MSGKIYRTCEDPTCSENTSTATGPLWLSIKSHIFTTFVERNLLGIPIIDFHIQGESYTFVQKQTMGSYILLPKMSQLQLLSYNVLEESSFSMTSDHLPILAEIKLSTTKYTRQHLFLLNTKRRPTILLVNRFMADLLRKYRGSVVIMVGRGGAEPHYVHN